MHSPYNSEELDAGSRQRLFELFSWENRETLYRVRFTDGEESELTLVFASQDLSEPPHASATVVRMLHRPDGGAWPARNAMFFWLAQVAQVSDPLTGEILYEAV